jgi:hypothetical protein
MSVLDWWPGKALGMAASLETHLLQPQIEPWVDNHLTEALFVNDVFGTGMDRPMSRWEAMAVPAMARARHMIVGAAARLPLEEYVGAVQVTPSARWMQSTNGQNGKDIGDGAEYRAPSPKLHIGLQSPWQRMASTVDDLLFYGEALWLITARKAEKSDPDQRPLEMVRIPFDRWTRDEQDEFVDVDHQPIGGDWLVNIRGPHEGVLRFGAPTIRQAADLERTAADIAARPLRFELHQTTDLALTPVERADLIARTRIALADNQGILFTNAAIETKAHPYGDAALLIAGRNAAALNVARTASVPAALIDATSEGASLEYATVQARNLQFLDYGLGMYLDAVVARLSMDDVLPSGHRAAFDTTALTTLSPASTGTPTED